jgi:hypothetical protein
MPALHPIARTLSICKCTSFCFTRRLLLVQSQDQLTRPLGNSHNTKHWVRGESLSDGGVDDMQVIHAEYLSVRVDASTDLAASAPVVDVTTSVLGRRGDVFQYILLRGCRREVERLQSTGRQGLKDLCNDSRHGICIGRVTVKEVGGWARETLLVKNDARLGLGA